jgi:ADP-heptose:LPS heptosyltransferase
LGRLRAAGPSTAPSTWRSIVIFGASHIGDVLYRTASLGPLRRALPGARIVYVCDPPVAELLTTNPDVDEVLPISDEHSWRWTSRTWSALRERRFDAALCSNHHGYHADLALATALGIPNRVAFGHKGLSGLATIPIVVPYYPMSMPAYFRTMVATIGGVAPDWPLEPVLPLTADDHREADAALRELALDANAAIVACTLTIRQSRTLVWPAASYLAVLAAAAREHPLQVVLCGSRDDGPLLRDVAAAAPVPCRVLAGRLGLRAFGAFLSHCDALLGTDSGPRHIANAVGTPVVFIRSLSVSRTEAGQYAAHEVDAAPDVEWLDLEAQAAAMARIDPASVAAALSRVLVSRARLR